MSIDISGQNAKLETTSIAILVHNSESLIKLANSIPWEKMFDAVCADLKATTSKGLWNVGRRIVVRIHLAIFLLQKIFDLTDRGVIERLQSDAVFQVFCGISIVNKWHVPAFTKVEEFRNRLSIETQQHLTNLICQEAVKFGFANPKIIDVDSTVQEANMAYAADGNLMVKLGNKVGKVFNWLRDNAKVAIPEGIETTLGRLGTLAKGYFFASKKDDLKRAAFAKLHHHVKIIVRKGLEVFESLPASCTEAMPWNIKLHFDHITDLGKRYLLDVAHYIRKGTMKSGKILAFHLKEIAYIKKGKTGKMPQFGREFQIARLAGNFVFAPISTSVRTNDKGALRQIIDLHLQLFGERMLKSLATDKGYYSRANINATEEIDDVHLGYQWQDQQTEEFHRLRNRRAGIEPIIGHIKFGGQLGRSRMKSDQATHAAGYGAMLGFNLRQIMRKMH